MYDVSASDRLRDLRLCCIASSNRLTSLVTLLYLSRATHFMLACIIRQLQVPEGDDLPLHLALILAKLHSFEL